VIKIGIIILVFGYFIPPFAKSALPSTIIFWLGFLFVLRSKQLANPEYYWAKGARWGLFVSILGFVTISIFSYAGNSLSAENNNIYNWFAWNLSYVFSPISHLAGTFFPPQYIQNPDGSITVITTLIRAVTYNFLNICTYISIGAIIGKLFIKQKSS